jgi:AraC-like DNA-binding protein
MSSVVRPHISNIPRSQRLLFAFGHYSRLRNLLRYLAEHIKDPIGLQDAAKAACMEPTAFSKFFKRTTGLCFCEFLQRLRVACAISYILACDNSLTEIAHLSGFGSIATFTRLFKKFTGVPPSVYRKQIVSESDSGTALNGAPAEIAGVLSSRDSFEDSALPAKPSASHTTSLERDCFYSAKSSRPLGSHERDLLWILLDQEASPRNDKYFA